MSDVNVNGRTGTAIFGNGSNINVRIIRDYESIKKIVDCFRGLNAKIVLTSGTFDLFHVGHSRYLEQAKNHGDVLIVGTDSDAKVKKIKGPNRPIVPEDERMEILCHCRHVDVVFLKGADDPRWELIRILRPDVLIVTQETYDENELVELRKLCGEVVVLESQASTSTTAKIRIMLIGTINKVKEKMESTIKDLRDFLDTLAKEGI